jgi:hypothetical protein
MERVLGIVQNHVLAKHFNVIESIVRRVPR